MFSLTAGETPADGDMVTEEAAEPVEPEPAEVPQPEPKSPEPGNLMYNISPQVNFQNLRTDVTFLNDT